MWINIKTGYSFKQVYGHLDHIAEKCKRLCAEYGVKEPFGGIADFGNTFAHIPWRKACKKAEIKPIYGVRLPVTIDLQREERRYAYNWMTFIAKNIEGLQELYKLVDLSNQQFYYRQRITYDQVNKTSGNIIILSGVAPDWMKLKVKVYQELSPSTPFSHRHQSFREQVACIDNFYPEAEDVDIYEPFADERLRERKTTPIHILSYDEWISECKEKCVFINTLKIASECNVEFENAPMIKYIGKDKVEEWCKKGAREKGIINKPEYIRRYKREMELIREKEYSDYFLVVADAIRYAKKIMAVGPGRGSSAGSLVCWLMGITELDPIQYDLFFERFIDINRFDLPDIDVDFQDDKRHLVVKYLEKKYGKENVAQIGNINRLKPKSAITRFAQALGINADDVHELKDSIMERSGGDARANLCMEDTFKDTEIGKSFIEKHPIMESVKYVEAHPSHTGVHAAGILVCNSPITNYCGINSRDNKQIGMLDKKDAESINLLKIDALGLTTMTILAEVCDQIGKPYQWIYEIPTDDPGAYKVFNDHRFNGIFQFEGSAVQGLAKSMPIDNMEDIAALTALGRPGPLVSGGASMYIAYRSGAKKVEYISSHPIVIEATKKTYGVIVYQEQVMQIVRKLGKLSWEKTSAIRKAMSGSLGIEFFDKMFVEFEKGAIENGVSKEEAEKIWKNINTMGSWSFNKSHAVSYALISYFCAYMKAHYPLEFLVANLRHAKTKRSTLKIIRDAVENDSVEYIWFNINKSMESWSVIDGKLYGGFDTFKGIGPAMAKKAVKGRNNLSTGIKNKVNAGISPYRYVYPAIELYGDYYKNPGRYNISNGVIEIKNIQSDGKFTIIGCMIKKNLRDANEACFVAKRNGKYLEGQTAWLNIVLEDDTGQIMCKIKKEDYERFGRNIAETGKEDKDWYLVHGQRINGWSILFVINIKRITEVSDEPA